MGRLCWIYFYRVFQDRQASLCAILTHNEACAQGAQTALRSLDDKRAAAARIRIGSGLDQDFAPKMPNHPPIRVEFHIDRGRCIDGHQAAVRKEDIRSEEHTSELQSLMRISYAVF